jgi:integrase
MSRARDRLYWRARGGERRAYADFRDYADVGGGREALTPPGATRATADPEEAEALYLQRLAALKDRRLRGIAGVPLRTGLATFVQEHLVARAKAGKVTDEWLAANELMLGRAVDHFGAARELATITTKDVRGYVEQLRARANGRGATLSDTSLSHHLGALSNLFTRAGAEGAVSGGYNPVAGLLDKPEPAPEEAKWLEHPDAALLLEAARTYQPSAPKGGRRPVSFAYELVATFLCTGGRESEILGLETGDVSLDRNTVTFRPNGWRRLKTKRSHRTVPLWPQLREILERYLAERPPTRLLFPSFRTGEEAMLTDWRKLLDVLVARAGALDLVVDGHRRRAEPGEVRSKCFRHTYTSARLQTVDGGKPIAVFTVSRELGHSSTAMVERVYSHLGDVRHRADAVEFRVEQHGATLGDRLRALQARFGTTADTTRLALRTESVSR